MNGHVGWARWLTAKRRDYSAFLTLSIVERIALLKARLPASVLDSLATDMHAPRQELLRWLDVPKASINRKLHSAGLLSLGEGERVLGILRIIGQVTKFAADSGDPVGFNSPHWTAAWLRLPNPALGWRQPWEYLATADGRNLISDLLARLQSEAHSYSS